MPLGYPGTSGTASPATGAAAAGLAGTTPRAALGAALYGEYGAPIAKTELAAALGQAQLGLLGGGLNVSAAELQQQAGFGFAGELLGMQGIGLQQQTLGREAATAAGQQGIEQAQFAITQQKYGQEKATAALSYAQKQFQATQNAAASGVSNTVGTQQAQAVAAQQYAWQQATIYRQQQLAALGQQSEQLGYATKAGGYANAQQQLQLAARKEGLTVAQTYNQLAFGLQQLGVKTNPLNYLSAISTAQGGAAQQQAAGLSQAALIGGLGANTFAGTT